MAEGKEVVARVAGRGVAMAGAAPVAGRVVAAKVEAMAEAARAEGMAAAATAEARAAAVLVEATAEVARAVAVRAEIGYAVRSRRNRSHTHKRL